MNVGTRSAILYPLALLTLLAILTAWINHMVQAPQPKLDGSSRHDPDYIMNNFVTSQTDINGSLRYKLAAAEMKHFPDDDTTDLQRPRYTQFAINKPYTQVEALRGYVSGDGEQVQLVDNVKITRQAFAGKGEMVITTEYLNILPNQDLVKTDSPVVITQAPKTVIHATGMVYEKDKRTVTLLNKVRAHYEKPSKRSNTPTNNAEKPVASKPITNSAASIKSKVNSKKLNKPTETATQKAASLLQKPNTSKTRIRRRYE
jgi:lipopolysaccharide export system protein LptC